MLPSEVRRQLTREDILHLKRTAKYQEWVQFIEKQRNFHKAPD